MNIDGFDMYQTKMNVRGRSFRERQYKNKLRDFDKYFSETLNEELVAVTDKNNVTNIIEMAFQDHSQSNNKQLSDDKYVIARNETPIHVGDYVLWRDEHWMIFTKEVKTIPTHQQALVKNANYVIKWTRDGEIVNDGKGYHAYIQSNTLYTMGVSETTYLDVVDGKMTMYMQNNKDTAQLIQDERIVIGRKVFKIKFMDTVSRDGLISFLMDEDRVHEKYDNLELGVADYYRYYNKDFDFTDDKLEDDEDLVVPQLEIVGNTAPKIGSIQKYTTDFSVSEWIVDDMNTESSYYLQHKDEHSITIKVKDDYRMVGSTINIIAKDKDGNYAQLTAMMSKKF